VKVISVVTRTSSQAFPSPKATSSPHVFLLASRNEVSSLGESVI